MMNMGRFRIMYVAVIKMMVMVASSFMLRTALLRLDILSEERTQ